MVIWFHTRILCDREAEGAVCTPGRFTRSEPIKQPPLAAPIDPSAGYAPYRPPAPAYSSFGAGTEYDPYRATGSHPVRTFPDPSYGGAPPPYSNAYAPPSQNAYAPPSHTPYNVVQTPPSGTTLLFPTNLLSYYPTDFTS